MRLRNMKGFRLTWNNTDLEAVKALVKCAGSDALCQLKCRDINYSNFHHISLFVKYLAISKMKVIL